MDEEAVNTMIQNAILQEKMIHQQELEVLKKQQEVALETARQMTIKQECLGFTAPADKRAVAFIMNGQYALADLFEHVNQRMKNGEGENVRISFYI